MWSLYRSGAACNCRRGAGTVDEQGGDPRRDPAGDRRAGSREAHAVGDRGGRRRLATDALPMVPDQGRPLGRHREYEEEQFDLGLRAVVDAHRSPARRLDAALHYLVTYLDGSARSRSDRRRPAVRAAVARPLAARPGRVAGTAARRRVPASAGSAQRRVVERTGRGAVPAPRVLALPGAASDTRGAARQPAALRRADARLSRSGDRLSSLQQADSPFTAAGWRAGSLRTRRAARRRPPRVNRSYVAVRGARQNSGSVVSHRSARSGRLSILFVAPTGNSSTMPDVARRPLGAEVALLGEERRERVRVERGAGPASRSRPSPDHRCGCRARRTRRRRRRRGTGR